MNKPEDFWSESYDKVHEAIENARRFYTQSGDTSHANEKIGALADVVVKLMCRVSWLEDRLRYACKHPHGEREAVDDASQFPPFRHYCGVCGEELDVPYET